MSEAIKRLTDTLGIAPGMVVGRLQHDGLIPRTQQNGLKGVVDLTYVLEGADGAEETWLTQTQATELLMRDLNLAKNEACCRLRRAAAAGVVATNGRRGLAKRFDPHSLAAWRLRLRDRDLDSDDRDETAVE